MTPSNTDDLELSLIYTQSDMKRYIRLIKST